MKEKEMEDTVPTPSLRTAMKMRCALTRSPTLISSLLLRQKHHVLMATRLLWTCYRANKETLGTERNSNPTDHAKPNGSFFNSIQLS
jgi:hypothetical protein